MMYLLSFLPVIFLAFVFGVIIFTASKTKSPQQQPRKTTQKRKAIIKGYFIVLLTSILLYSFLQTNRDVIGDVERNEELKKIDQEFNNAINNGDFDHEAIKEVQQWQFTLESEKLLLTNLNEGEGLSFIVYVEKVDDLEGKVMATYYMKNVEEKIYHPNKPKITWNDTASELMLKQYRKDIQLHVMSKEYPIRQFSGESWFGERQSPTFDVHDQVLYIRVPTGTQVEPSDFLYVQEVN